MTAERVIELLTLLRSGGVEATLDGGWGVDALLGHETRPHADLDLVVSLGDASRIQEALRPLGFTLHEDHLPVRFVLRGNGEQLDFHTVTFDAEGGGVQPQPGGGSFRYPPEGFVSGTVAGAAVPCISAAVQLLCHLGYEPSAKDAHDVLQLCRAFGLAVPVAYARFLGATVANMVLEVAILKVRSGASDAFEAAFREAQTILSASPGYQRHELRRCLEAADQYLLLVWWDSLESHTEGFRKSAGYQRWRQLLHHFYDPFPTVEHYVVVPGT